MTVLKQQLQRWTAEGQVAGASVAALEGQQGEGTPLGEPLGGGTLMRALSEGDAGMLEGLAKAQPGCVSSCLTDMLQSAASASLIHSEPRIGSPAISMPFGASCHYQFQRDFSSKNGCSSLTCDHRKTPPGSGLVMTILLKRTGCNWYQGNICVCPQLPNRPPKEYYV